MRAQRPTSLRLLDRHCPKALDHYDARVPYDTRVFAVGVAAHDVLEAVAKHGRGSVDAVCQALISIGREGIDAQPPLPASAVFEGRDLALAWVDKCDGVLGSEAARYEAGIGFDEDWKPAKYSEAQWFRCRLDVVDVVEFDDEESAGVGLMTQDYKSAWNADAAVLDSLQLRAQAVALWLQWERFMSDRPDFIRQSVVNLRTRQEFHRDLWLDSDAETLEKWKRDVEIAVAAANVTPRRANPGTGCLGCGYALSCSDGRAWLQRAYMVTDPEPEFVARAYAASLAHTKAWEELAREVCNEGAVDTGSSIVGFVAKPQSEATPGAVDALWERWTLGHAIDEGAASLARGLLRALDLGASQVRAGARALFPDRKQKTERDEFVAGLLTEKLVKRFVVERKAEDASGEGEAA